MKKSYVLDEIDCANCAAKLENAINKIDGVNKATVNFFAGKLIIDIDDDKFDTVFADVLKLASKMFPDCEIR